MTVAVCATVLNEAGGAAALAESLLDQRPQPDELVIVDGGSTDGTTEILRETLAGVAGAQLIEAPGTNIATGRNLAARATTAGLVAFTDAGITRGTDWLGALVAAVECEPTAAGSFGYVLAGPTTPLEAAIGAVGLPLAEEVDPAHYPPSSGAFLLRREWFERSGGYPAWLGFGEDLWLDREVWSAGGWFAHAPGADVSIRPRSNLQSFFRQYYNYAFGDGHAGMFGRRHFVRFAFYVLGTVLLRRGTWGSMALLILLSLIYVRRPLARARRLQRGRSTALALVPAGRLVGDGAKMAGYLAGRWRRLNA